MFPHVPFQTCVNNITHRAPPREPASPQGQRAKAMVTRKLGRNCTTFSSHIPICHRRNTPSSGPKSPHCVAARAAPTLMNTAAAALPSCRKGGKCGLAFRNNDDNKGLHIFWHVAVSKLAPDTDCTDKMSPFGLTLWKKKQKTPVRQMEIFLMDLEHFRLLEETLN